MEGLKISATAVVKLMKYNESGQLVDEEQHEVSLTEKEAEALWHLQQED